ncbi:anaphase-promoting complex, cyclosome, subunit 3 [Leptospira perolatii]|uniref:Anaphase-promoting complex, cyclosome, subunit 3 n=1 Tax=Leptospira perolatii TaxID=2023191 RepID=A0A2M9ZRJ1_9LEPT|nr:tetratricopeptide repeat protein [Leptospira perolatii]PJZ71049.1 anaphase-promoting complex, cyclosome, subunit 3 [Leptospira perolatii]PJZ74581.1 anaphase-promoting complex, cyclosome, subunit 3 [Leptospira perolatii]
MPSKIRLPSRRFFSGFLSGVLAKLRRSFAFLYALLLLVGISFPALADLKEGKKAYARKDYAEALRQFQKFNESNPSSGEAWMYMGYIYESRKDYTRSIQAFKRAVNLHLPKKDIINCYQKIILFHNYHRDFGEVITYANRLLRIAPDLTHIQKMKTAAEERYSSVSHPHKQTQTEEKEEHESIASLEKKLSHDPTNHSIKWQLSLAYYHEKEFTKAEDLLIQLIKSEPDNIEYAYKYGALLVRVGRHQEALEILNRTEPKIPSEREKLLYFTHLTQAAAYHKMRKLDEAAKYYRKAMHNRNTVVPLIGLIKIKWQVKDCENALKTAEKALEFGEKTREIRMYIGLCKIQTGKSEEGYEILREIGAAIEKENPELKDLSEVYNDGILKLARYYTNAGDYQKALRYFKSVQPDEEELREYRFYLGKAYFYTGAWDKSIPLLEKIENSPSAFLLLAKCYAAQGDMQKTMEAIKKATELKPSLWNAIEQAKDFKKFEENSFFKAFIETRAGTKDLKKQDSNTSLNDDPSDSE